MDLLVGKINFIRKGIYFRTIFKDSNFLWFAIFF